MPFKAAQAYELDRSDSPSDSRAPYDEPYCYSTDSETSQIDELDPLKSSSRPYRDDASQRLRSVFDTKTTKPAARSRKWRFCCVLVLLFVATLVLLLSAGGLWAYKEGVPEDGQSEGWYPSPRGGTAEKWAESYRKAAEMVGQMTLVEKVNVTTGVGWSMGMCVGNTGPVDRLGFPSLCLQDGPLGLRFADNATAFPAGVTVGATWNKKLMYERGKAHGFEARMKGIHVLLGPSMGPLGRLPAGGRNWEGFGSDPVLQGIAAAETIKGIQDSGVIATAKHYVANEQEHFRQSWEWGTPNAISSNIDDRTMHEIYAWPFAESVRAGVASVMCSYNQLNNSYACQNSKLLNGILKEEMGFQGFVQSDWLAQRSGVASTLAGLDMTMPGDGLTWQDGKTLWGPELTKSVLNGTVPMERLNDMALRIVAAWYQLKQDDQSVWPNATNGGGPNFSSWTNDETGLLHPGSPNSHEKGVVNKFVPVRNTKEGGDHDALARQIAAEGIVLVKNEDKILPLRRDARGLVNHNGKVRIAVFGEDAFANPKGNNACPDRGCNEGTLAMGWGSGAVELPYLVTPVGALKQNFDSDKVHLTAVNGNSGPHIDSFARDQDLCIVFINADAGEGFIASDGIKGDRNDLYPQKGGDSLVQKVAFNCGGIDSNGTAAPTLVVLHTVGPTILERWIEHPGVKGVLIAHLPGQESGNALADVLFGDVNPSGRLPYTIAKKEADYGPDSGILFYPNGVVPQQDFSEGLYIDYRYLDAHNLTPRYEFGFGLSYTTFKLSSVVINPVPLGSSTPPLNTTAQQQQPPDLPTDLPDPSTALFPAGFKKLKKYIYPYLPSLASATPSKKPYPYPPSYSPLPHAPSPASARGNEGGNPALYAPALNLQATLSNTGSVPGSAVVQLYISLPPNITSPFSPEGKEVVDTPVRVLRRWEKIEVGVSNEEKRQAVKMVVSRKDVSYWDVWAQEWVVPRGEFGACVGFSSRDLGHCSTFELVG